MLKDRPQDLSPAPAGGESRPLPQERVSVVIPVLNAEPYLPELFEAIFSQQPLRPFEVILVDSLSTDRTVEIASRHRDVKVVPIERFTHGRARNLGVRHASGEIVVLLTQDALPRDEHWLIELLRPFSDPQVGAAYSRQVPRPGANPMESYFLSSHFPPGPAIRREKVPGEPLTLSGVFFSNVSSAARRDLLVDHPFDETLIMSEDQQFSRDILEAGHSVAYAPESVVIHSHEYTLGHVFRRYFDSIFSLTVIFREHGMGTSVSMGTSYLAREAKHIVRRHPLWIPRYFLYVTAKTLGTLAGHFALKLPLSLRRRMSLHRYHWDEPSGE